jgi:hypothetical protein
MIWRGDPMNMKTIDIGDAFHTAGILAGIVLFTSSRPDVIVF